MSDITYNFAQQGWQCPICKRVYSPTTAMCFYCGGDTKSTTATGPITISKDCPNIINLGYPDVINVQYDHITSKDVKNVDC